MEEKYIIHLKETIVVSLELYNELKHKDLNYSPTRLLYEGTIPECNPKRECIYYIKGKLYAKTKPVGLLFDSVLEETLIYCDKYYNSKNIKTFTLHHQDIWLNKMQRLDFGYRIENEEKIGKKVTNLWVGDRKFLLSIESAKKLLLLLNNYIIECYDVNKNHIKNIKELNSYKAIVNYKYKKGYPKKLNL